MLSVGQDYAGHSATLGDKNDPESALSNNMSDRTINDKCLVNILHFACFSEETAYKRLCLFHPKGSFIQYSFIFIC